MELGRSNVCIGVQKSWPKRMFKKQNFDDLEPKEQRCIIRDMERKAVLLHNKYVDEERMKQRCRRRTKNTLAWYYEKRYRKNLFMRVKALGEKENDATGDNGTTNAMVDNELEEIISSDEDDDDRLVIDESLDDTSTNQSQVTVINSGQSQLDQYVTKTINRKQASQIDLNANSMGDADDDDDGIIDYMVNDENVSNNSHSIHSQTVTTVPKRSNLNKRAPLTVQQTSIKSVTAVQQLISLHSDDEDEEIDINTNDNSSVETFDRFNDVLSQSVVTSTVPDRESPDLRPSQASSPVLSEYHVLSTPAINRLRDNQQRFIDEDLRSQIDEDSSDIDSLDFLSQNMMGALTSTQENNVHRRL